MEFRYFRNPEAFALKVEEDTECSICKRIGRWFFAGGYAGINNIECICQQCLIGGELETLEIEANQAFGGTLEQTNTIIYKTPALPTWQLCDWPFFDGDYCVFESVASKADFDNKNEFIESLFNVDKEKIDLNWLWHSLPDCRLSGLDSKNISVYLFSRNSKKLSLLDLI